MRKLSALLFAGLLMASGLTSLGLVHDVGGGAAVGKTPSYTAHASIRINSDADFAIGTNGVTAGDGSPGNPWLIEGWDINGDNDCIYIGNTTDHFNVLNCSLYNAEGSSLWPYYCRSGITLYNVWNGSISSNNISANYNCGIHIYQADNIVIFNNTASYNTCGILIENVCDVTVEQNLIAWNNYDGLYIQRSSSNIIEGNTIENNGQFGMSLWESDNNFVQNNHQSNSRAGYYCSDSSGYNIFLNNTAKINTESGFHLYFSHNNILYRNSVTNSYAGIYMYATHHNTIMGTSMTDCGIDMGDFAELANAESHVITSNNTVNMKPVYYWHGQTGGTIPLGAGQVILVNCSGVTVQNQLVIHGSLGIALLHSQGNYILNNDASSNNRGGIMLYESDSNTLTGNYADSVAGYGICLAFSCYAMISNNAVNGFHISGYYEDNWNTHTIDTTNTVYGKPVYYWKDRTSGTVPGGAGQVILANCEGVTISNQSISDAYIGVLLGFSNRNTIRNVSVSDSIQEGISMWMSDNNKLYDNVVTSNNGDGILCSGADNTELIGNAASLNTYSGIRLRGCDNAVMKGNSAISNGENGIYFDNSYDGFLENNDCDSNQENGIFLLGGARFILVNNTADWNNEIGFELWAANENLLVHNIARNNDEGFCLWSTSSNMLYGNNASFSTFGFHLVDSDNTDIRNNDAFSNQYGIELGHSDNCQIRENRLSDNLMRGMEIPYTSINNTIYHNDFHNNAVNAYDINNNNFWNASYPKGGNYWSDYAGSDVLGGANQDQPGADGIGDVPYTNIMNTVTDDNYPLIAGTLNRPNIELVSPANNSLIANGTEVRFDVWDRDVDVDEVNYSVNGGAFESIDYPFSVDTSDWPEGINNLTIRAADDDSNTVSAVYSFLTDSNPPEVEAGPDVFTNKQYVQNATASDGLAGIANYTWSEVAGYGSITFGDPFSEDTSVLAYADGTYDIQLTVTDNFGHMATDNLTVTWDTVLPDVAAGDNVTTNGQFIQNGTANDTGSGIAACRWTVASGPGDITFGDSEAEDTTMVATLDGTYTVELNASDRAGNSASDRFTLVWDTTPPNIGVANLGNKTGFWLNITDTNFMSAYCANGSVNISCTGAKFVDTSPLTPGWHNYTVWANDLANNSAGDRITLYIEPPPPPLAIVNTVPADGAAQVPVHGNISIEFNQPMDVSSVAVEISVLPNNVTLNYSWNDDSTILTIAVMPGLSQNTLYTVKVGSSAKSMYEVMLDNDFYFSFTTWTDSDGDNLPDDVDSDDDNDGVLDEDDAFPLDPDESLDNDKDGIGNNADPDDDNDGVPDGEDFDPLDPDVTEDPDAVEDPGIGSYLWIVIILIAAIAAGAAIFLMRRKKPPVPEQAGEVPPPPPDEPPSNG